MVDHDSFLMRKFAFGSMVTLSGVLLGSGFLFAFQVACTRLFGPKYYGFLVISLTVVEFIRIACSLGMPRGGMRYLSVAIGAKHFHQISDIIAVTLTIPFLICAGAGVLLFISADEIAVWWFRNPELGPFLALFSICLPFIAIIGCGVELSRGFSNTLYATFTENVFLHGSWLIWTLLFFIMGLGYYSMALAVIATSIGCAVLIILFLKRQVKSLTGESFSRTSFIGIKYKSLKYKDIITYSIPLFLTGFIIVAVNSVNIIMLGRFCKETEVGIYAAASVISMLLSRLLIMPVNSILSPMIATEFGGGRIDNIRQLYLTSTRWLCYAATPIATLIIIARNPIMSLFGNAFILEGSVALLILTIGQYVNCTTGITGILLAMTGHQKLELWANVSTLSLNIALNLILIPRLGIIGAATSNMISQVVINGIRVLITNAIFRVQPITMCQAGLFFMSLALIAIFFWIKPWFSGLMFDIFFAGISALAIVGSTYRLFLTDADKALLRSLVNRKMKMNRPVF
ncbi:MAG: flippase [Syntrophales bacterium]|nr:flippase [Syntrophales bacterium]